MTWRCAEAIYNLHWLTSQTPWQSAVVFVGTGVEADMGRFLSDAQTLDLRENHDWRAICSYSAKVSDRPYDVVVIINREVCFKQEQERTSALRQMRNLVRKNGNVILVRVADAGSRLRIHSRSFSGVMEDAGIRTIARYFVDPSFDRPLDLIPDDHRALLAWHRMRQESALRRFWERSLFAARLPHRVFSAAISVGEL
jgi:hypothetical protein